MFDTALLVAIGLIVVGTIVGAFLSGLVDIADESLEILLRLPHLRHE